MRRSGNSRRGKKLGDEEDAVYGRADPRCAETDGSGPEGSGVVGGVGRERSDTVHTEVEVRRDGGERGAAVAGVGGGEPVAAAARAFPKFLYRELW